VHDSQLLKGVLGTVLLQLLVEQESYGYELVMRVHAVGLVEVPDGSIYPALGRLERDGHVTSRLVASRSGPARKYYRLTASGRVLLAQKVAAWRALAAVVDPLLSRPTPASPMEEAA
jgi:PadR family transcriptional regulator PadR